MTIGALRLYRPGPSYLWQPFNVRLRHSHVRPTPFAA